MSEMVMSKCILIVLRRKYKQILKWFCCIFTDPLIPKDVTLLNLIRKDRSKWTLMLLYLGINLVIRDHNGDFLIAPGKGWNKTTNPELGKTIAPRHAVRFISNISYNNKAIIVSTWSRSSNETEGVILFIYCFLLYSCQEML